MKYGVEIKHEDGNRYFVLENHPDLVSAMSQITKVMEEYKDKKKVSIHITKK